MLAGKHAMGRLRDACDKVKPLITTSPYISPYLGLRSRLSQVWINRWTILLFLVLVRTLLAIADLKDGINDSKREAMSACIGVESMGTAIASMPHYMAQGTNELAAHGVEKAINGLMSMITMGVTAIEELVVFVINMLTQTYVCLITLAVRGALHVALQVVEDVGHFLNKTLGEIGSGIHKGIDDFENDLNKVVGGLNKVGSVFGGHSDIPTLDVNSDLDRLDNLHLPDGLDEGISKLNSSIPTFDQVNNFTNNAIRFPFEEIKKLISQKLPHYTFNRSLFPVPAKDSVSFCSKDNGISDFFQGLLKLMSTAHTVAILVLVLLALLMCIPMAFREWYRWKTMQQRIDMINEHGHDTMDVIYIASRPYTATVGIKLAGWTNSYRRKTLVRWIVAYITSDPALFVLSLGIAGLFSALCHLLVLKAVTREAPKLAHEVGDFADEVVNNLNLASVKWANGTNGVILGMNDKINHDVFGWVNTSTSAMNDTLNTFVTTMTGALNHTFGGTVLQDPINDVFNCLIGLKVASMEKGLTWVKDHAHIDFPLLPNNTFSMGAAASMAHDKNGSNFLADPSGEATDQLSGVLKHLIEKVQHKIELEAIISGTVVAIYGVIVLFALIRALSLWFGHNISRGEIACFHKHSKDEAIFPATHDEKRPSFVADDNPFSDPRDRAPGAPPSYPAAQGAPANSAGNQFRGAEYTLQPRPFPGFKDNSRPEDQQLVSPVEEKFGYAGERPVETQQPHVRHPSVHPDLTVTSPTKPTFNSGKPDKGNTFDRLGV